MVDGSEPSAHGDSLFNLSSDFLLAKRFDHDEGDGEVECSGVHPNWQESCSHQIGEIPLLNEEHVRCCVHACKAVCS